MARVGIIPDTHLPAVHPGGLAFVRDLFEKHRCDTIVHIGDEVDHHAISFHAKHPDAPGPSDEYELAFKCLRPWIRTFPNVKVCIGNHTARVARLAESVNIPTKYLRSYEDVWKAPGWEWKDEFVIDGVLYFHGTGSGGIHPAFNSARQMGMAVVRGHIHSAAGIKWMANPMRRWFGMDTGALVDDRAIAFAYGKHLKVRSILSAGVVIDGIPQHFIMPCGPGEKYNRSKFKRR